MVATLSADDYWDKVYACWLGKNCGGTLGAPWERVFGQDEPFDVVGYTNLREGGIPNDDLEMQLVWLKAVEEVGFDLTSYHLAQYWLDHIGYNFDEYGLGKTNLRLGLLPPVSGYYNNWFRDCMGAPIRSEIWACIAPGLPALAVRYAYEDAIVDHAGGEGVWGEVFNAAVESAAFVESDLRRLLEIGLGYIPPACATAQAVRAACAAHATGLDWRAARRHVLATTPHDVAQYAPINVAFQVVGWLYGTDFGAALRTTVNCGYDTDCTGATVGAVLGILGGRRGLPREWTAPLGDAIATNESWGGLRHVSTGPNPIPTTLRELTDRVCALGTRLLAARGADLRIGDHTDLNAVHPGRLHAPADLTAQLWTASPSRLRQTLGSVSVEVDYGPAPVVAPGTPTWLQVHVHNDRAADVTLTVRLTVPAGWTVNPAELQEMPLAASGSTTLWYAVSVDDPSHLRNTNRCDLVVQPRERPAEPAVPVVLLGARRWLVWGPRARTGAVVDAVALLDDVGEPEAFLVGEHAVQPGPVVARTGHGEGWRIEQAPDNALPPSIGTDWSGVLYTQLFLWNPRVQEVRLGVAATCPRKLWLNGRFMHQVRAYGPLRPNYGHSGGDGISYVDATLERGWNALLVKYTRDVTAPPFAAHLTLSTTDLYHGVVDVGWTQLPCDVDPDGTIVAP